MNQITKLAENDLGNILDTVGKIANQLGKKRYTMAFRAANILSNLCNQFRYDLLCELNKRHRRQRINKQ